MNTLPQLQAIFEKLKAGYHLSHQHGPLHTALVQDFESYAVYFAVFGMTLIRHHLEFFSLEAEERDAESTSLPKVAVFSYILIDHIANNQGQPVADTLMTSTFSLRGLPHFALDSHRALLRQVELHEPDHLRGVVNYLE